MAEQQRQGYCEECGEYRLVKRRGVTHILHLLLSVITAGLWLFVWIFLSIFTVGGWRCQTCGSDRIKDTGEMLSVRGWIVISLLALVFAPMLLALFSDVGLTSEEAGNYLVLVPILALPVLAVMAYNHHTRKRERIAGRADATKPEPKAAKPKPENKGEGNKAPSIKPKTAPKEKPEPPPQAFRPPQIERIEPDTSAAEEFRRRMRDADEG